MKITHATHPLACLFLLLALGCSSAPGEQDPKELLEMHREFALRYYDENDLLRAEQQVNEGLKISPRDEKLRLMKGWIRQRRGSAEDVFAAEQIFRSLASTKDYRAMLGLGEALERKGVLYWESAVAVEAGERFTTARDKDKRARELRRDASASWRESIQQYERTLEHKPGEIQAINGLQRVYALQGDHEQALHWSRKLLAQSESEATFWARQLERPDLTAGEEARLRDLLASCEELQVATHFQGSTLLVRMGRAPEALEHLDRVLELVPETPGLHSRRAQVLHQLGRVQEALASLENYLRYSDEAFDHPDVTRAMALMSQWQRELEESAN